MINISYNDAGRICIWFPKLDAGIHLLPFKNFRHWGYQEITPFMKVFGVGPVALIVLPE